MKDLANLTANTKNYGQIKLNSKPHSDALLRQFQLFQKFPKTAEDSRRLPKISKNNRRFPRGSPFFFNEKKQKQKQKQMTSKLKNEKPSNSIFFGNSKHYKIGQFDSKL